MDRKRFLGLLGCLALGYPQLARAGVYRQRPAAGAKEQILVVGAGLAGLAAASELQAEGHEVIVIEARDRIGGRIWTNRDWPELPLDWGASWVHGIQGNPLTSLADAIQAQRLITSYDKSAIYDTSGKRLTEADEERLEKLRSRIVEALKRVQRDNESDDSIRGAIESVMREFGPGTPERRWVEFILSSEFEQEYAGSAEQLSTHWYDAGEKFPGEDALFAQGFGVIAEHLATGLNIECEQLVTEIRWGETPIRVLTERRQFTADRVVVTLPLGVLRAGKVRFVPELPHEKREAIARLGVGVLNKCYLRFPQVFWPQDVDWLEYVSERQGEWTEWVSLYRVARQPILLGFNAGEHGRAIEDLSDERIVASALQTLTTIFGSAIPQPTGFQITRWGKDPNALGSYSFNAVGSTPGMRRDLASSIAGRVFFAGEATHRAYFGTAHGAYLSGLRAAKAILSL